MLAACTSAPDPSTAPPAGASSGSASGAATGSGSASAAPSGTGSASGAATATGSASGAPSGGAAPSGAGTGGTAPSSTDSPPADALLLTILESGGKVTPNGQKLNVRVGQQVTLDVTSDRDDEIHAHIGGDGYELKVQAGVDTTGSFTLDSAGSFEVESHKLDKVIVILNAR